MSLGIYVHIPFCQQKCLYCDFPSQAHMEHLYCRYTAALCREIVHQGGTFLGAHVDTVYIGGGTPTVLPLAQLQTIIGTIKKNFTFTANVEFSIEANPGTVDAAKLEGVLALGVNRISFGVQTFNDRLLQAIGRIHSAATGIEAVKTAQSVGFGNINIDLMYGLPHQTADDFSASLAIAMALAVPHISVYGLKVEENTPFAEYLASGKLDLPDEDEEVAMYDFVTAHLPAAGWKRYEISNYALPGYACRHNLGYWRFQPYIGLGAAAHSFYEERRRANTADIEEYIAKIESGHSAQIICEELDLATAMAEFVFLQLRTANGLDTAAFNNRFEVDFFTKFGEVINRLKAQKLLKLTKQGMALTDLGMKFGNIAFRAFLPD
jgi:oxygen-independent coproporphyrinogen-3 oxidase